MLPSKPRSSDGCWTCRLRRKKCDEERPVCAACLSLEIECHYSDAKPEWMDGADLQRDKAEAVKKLIKRKAAWRRERRHLQGLESGLRELEMTDGPDGLHISTAAAPRQPAAPSSSPPNGHGHDQAPQPPALRSSSNQHAAPSPPSPGGPASSSSGFSPPYHVDTSQSTSPESTAAEAPPRHPVMFGGEHERDVALAITYCDFVFPFLFPFYRPQMLLGGRSWLLIVLNSNKTLFHAALSLASYFLTSMLHGGENTSCRVVSQEEMYRQQNLTVKELMLDVTDINENGVKGRLKEATRVLAAIMQVLCFEVAVGNTGGSSWVLHLEGAVVLLDQVFKLNAETANNVVCWNSVMRMLDEGMGSHPRIFFPRAAVGQQTPVRPMTMMNSNQSCLSFFAAVLLYFDIVSSTALEAAPRLHCYHIGLLHVMRDVVDTIPALKERFDTDSGEDSDPDAAFLDLSQVMGAANWALIAIGEVAALDAWKKQQRASGSLSVTDLVLRGANIEWPLRRRIARLDSILSSSSSSSGGGGDECQTIVSQPHRPQHPLPVYVTAQARIGDFERGPRAIGGVDGSTTTSWVTRIWAEAALSYLHVVVNGWQPASPALRESVGLTLTLLRTRLPSPDCLRTFAWPLAVTGCLASPEEEEPLRQLVRDVGPLDIFGSVKEAWTVMEGVWARRAEIEAGEGGEWDIARCFGIGGRKVFLV